jgi:protein required for attachment to host cells
VAADSSRARILQVLDREQRLQEIDDLMNPQGRLQDRELTTGAHPRRDGSTREEPSAVEHSVDLFSKRIGDYLEKARTDHRYDRLVLVAPPAFLGSMRKELGKEVGKLVVDELDRNLSWFNARDIEAYLRR